MAALNVVMDWAEGDTRHEGVHKAGCRDIRDADPIADVQELAQLVTEDHRRLFPCARALVAAHEVAEPTS